MTKRVWAAALAGAMAANANNVHRAQESRTDPVPGTKPSIDQLRAQMFRVSAGRRLEPAAWPDGNRAAVALMFDVDNATPQLARGQVEIDGPALREYGSIDYRECCDSSTPMGSRRPSSCLRSAARCIRA